MNGFTLASNNQEPPGKREIENRCALGVEKNLGPRGSREAGDLYVTCQKRKLDKPQKEASKLESKLSQHVN